MLRAIYVAFFILIATPAMVQSQTAEQDSLVALLKGSRGEERLRLLFKLSEVISDADVRIGYARDAIKVARKLDNDERLIDAYENMAIVCSEEYRDSIALSYFWKVERLSSQKELVSGLLRAYKGLSSSYYYLDSLRQSVQYIRKLLGLAEKVDSVSYQAYAYLWLGRITQAQGDADSSVALIKRALDLYDRLGDRKAAARAYNALGRIYYDAANYQMAVECYGNEIALKEAIHDAPQYLAIAYLNLGRAQIALSNFQLALEQYQKALRTFESIGNEEGIAVSNSGIGMIYENLSQSTLATKENEANYRKALGNYQIALALFRKLQFRKEEGQTLLNIGNVYSRLATNRYVEQFGEAWEDSLYKISRTEILKSFEQALTHYEQALDIFKELEIVSEISKVYTNIGSIYSWARTWNKANSYIAKAIRISRVNSLNYELSTALFAMGESYYRQGNIRSAESAFMECVKLSQNLGLKETLRYSYDRLSRLYEQMGSVTLALAYFKKAVKIKDEIFTEKSQKAIAEMQTKYETEKKEQELKLMKNQDELQKSIIQRQKLMIIGAIIGSVLILMVALLMFKMFRDKQRANVVLEEKNELITRQKQEITDSIKYASRIQTAVLPSSALISNVLPRHFVLFLPRDIVSGDFYWMTRKNNKIVLVAADCTGHGVPGAFMSMLGVSFLYEIVNKENIMEPAKILDHLRNHIKTTLSQTGKMEEQKDGMDISLCLIDRENMLLQWAGAYNPLYRIRNGELTEYKADKMPVAVHINDYKSFTNHTIEVKPDDSFYMFSDGFADQFGGERGRKFMTKNFKNLLLSIWDKPMDEQHRILKKAHVDWRGEREQIDDVLVIGFRV